MFVIPRSKCFQMLSRSRSLWCLRRCLGQSASDSRILAAIDFDKTIVQQDSYLAVSQLLPNSQQGRELQQLIPKCGWLTFISRVLELLHCEHKIKAATVGKCVRRLAAVPGMLRVVRRLALNPALDLCIISDSNSFFISEWLREYDIEDLFAGVYTNPGCVQASGELLVLPYAEQTGCDLCPANLCKGAVVQELLSSGRYDRVVYVGDSCNDLCAMKQLGPKDVACIRRGYELYEKLVLAAGGNELNCSVLTWRDGHELEEWLMDSELVVRPGGY